ncbi:hypothetical protein [Burkholderia plantarii]|uniref:hypothetical protein n=2 Tax=Burkholderia plantarii TaxID=41899 RepID=UPI0008707C92|nr:hypothetical protein [Burkholderia plantarii]
MAGESGHAGAAGRERRFCAQRLCWPKRWPGFGMAARYRARGQQDRKAAAPETAAPDAPREAHTDIAAGNETGRINMFAIERN